MSIPQGNNSSCVLYLGAIPYNWDVEVIKSVVCGSGPVVDVRCMMDNASKNKGFCFVEYSSPDAASKALNLLSKIKIEGRKKLRIELSKEGLRNPVPGQKPELRLNRNFLPSNVIIPSEMLSAVPNSQVAYAVTKGASTTSAEIAAIMASNPQIQQMVSQMIANGMDMNQISAVVKQLTHSSSQPAVQQPQPRQSIPQQLSMASQYMPMAPSSDRSNSTGSAAQAGGSQIYAKDKVSETLASIPPGLLVELLAQLKLVLSGPSPNYAQAASILHDNPKLAAAAAQSLLLMGIIDLDVINETMNGQFVVSGFDATSAAALPHTNDLLSSNTATSRNVGGFPASNSSPMLSSSSNSSSASPTPLPLPQQSAQGLQKPVNPEWLSFPQHTISKLMSISDQEAALIVQVLKLTPQQITNLPENERMMANQIRAQYL